jgi:ribosomal protein S12 methylthiotransferase accessory factor
VTVEQRPGTDATASTDEERIVDGFFAALAPGDAGEVDVTEVDRTGVGVISADHTDPDGGRAAGFGYGTTLGAARIGAWAELAEEVLLSRALAATEPVRGSYRELAGRRGQERIVDPVTLVPTAGTVVDPDQPRWWLPTTRWRTGEEVLVAAEFVANGPGDVAWQPAGERLITPITNGAGAGLDPVRAVAHGLGELLQRDGNAAAFRAMDPGIVIDTGTVRDPGARALLERFDAAGIEVTAKLASTGFDVPCLHVVGVDRDLGAAPHPIALTACGEAAHPDRDEALRKALLEFAHSRTRKFFVHGPLDRVRPLAPDDYWARELARPLGPQERRAFRSNAAWAGMSAEALHRELEPVVLAEHTRIGFDTLPTVAPGTLDTPAAVLEDLLARLADFDVLTVLAPGPDPRDPSSASAFAAKVIVPGIEAETMSYGRIGARGVARLLARDSELVGLGAPPHPGAAPVALTAEGREALGGDAWLDLDGVARTVGPLYALYREPARHAIPRAADGEPVDLV